MIKKIAVLTSGGDSPGMNAAIRSIVRTSCNNNIKVLGVLDGYLGLCKNRIIKLNKKSVSNIINKGGTFLGTARYKKFYKKKTREIAILNMKNKKIDALIAIGGNGTYIGANKLNKMNFPCISIPGTIDNDIFGTDYTIGYSTALETVVQLIDKLRDTSCSHKRITIIEIMGRNCGDLTLFSSIAGGCQYIIIPEIPYNEKKLIKKIKKNVKKEKKNILIGITEHICNVKKLAKKIEKEVNQETRATVLGHIQRGGAPVAFDRILASKMGYFSVKLLLKKKFGKCIGIKNNKIIYNDINYAFNFIKKKYDKKIIFLAKNLF
ncbi:MAG: 6-phosphofructokinase [Buchnera aphidicola (Periphyllus lyropictus)]|uniref:6-phosphofructokinase n=1 Tax=Buchnera aphidicola TaxID=9 RepID=UPI001ECD5B83|nr:6-phosphofructokinase [Buchnera aphidicola]NIH16827.1 6-phosphofructokinase [Buchnera aphidicola (Periphyllus lyropictus)]USS94828.1 6-phosphofructokinase [Buchnera aphidicola (Periphyllus lyropictus)]